MSGVREESTPISRHTRSWIAGKPHASTLQGSSQGTKFRNKNTVKGNQAKQGRKTMVTKVGRRNTIDDSDACVVRIKEDNELKDNPLVDTMAETVCNLSGGLPPPPFQSPHSSIHPPLPTTPRNPALVTGILQDQPTGAYDNVMGYNNSPRGIRTQNYGLPQMGHHYKPMDFDGSSPIVGGQHQPLQYQQQMQTSMQTQMHNQYQPHLQQQVQQRQLPGYTINQVPNLQMGRITSQTAAKESVSPLIPPSEMGSEAALGAAMNKMYEDLLAALSKHTIDTNIRFGQLSEDVAAIKETSNIVNTLLTQAMEQIDLLKSSKASCDDLIKMETETKSFKDEMVKRASQQDERISAFEKRMQGMLNAIEGNRCGTAHVRNELIASNEALKLENDRLRNSLLVQTERLNVLEIK